MKGKITMNTKEVNRIAILTKLSQGEIKQAGAAGRLGISTRQVRRLLKKFRRDGAAGIVHGLRGVKSNNRINPEALETAIIAVKDRYPDFSITLAHEKLAEHHGFLYSRETLRRAMITADLWKPKRQPLPVIHPIRERRWAEGELVQFDGSPHTWFEDRGPYCTLLVYIDDATGKLLWLEFTVSETTTAYFLATRRYLERHGKPIAFYSDKHSVFRINTTRKSTAATDDDNGLTQFGRAMRELSIEMIFANSPQAKGRVERANQTLQDRLVKELRLRNINTIDDANRYTPEFMEEFNKRFGVIPKDQVDAHRPLLPSDKLDEILLQKHTRTLSQQLTLSYQNKIYQIETNRPGYAMRHAKVTVRQDLSGLVTIVYRNTPLTYRVIAKLPKSAVIDSKHLNRIVDEMKARAWPKPAPNHPWRQYAAVSQLQATIS